VKELKARRDQGEVNKSDNNRREDCDQTRSRLRCFYTNACSLLGNMVEFRQKIENFDIVAVTETWASDGSLSHCRRNRVSIFPTNGVVSTSGFDVAMLNSVPRVHISVSVNVSLFWASSKT